LYTECPVLLTTGLGIMPDAFFNADKDKE
jgi:hypothetical protein